MSTGAIDRARNPSSDGILRRLGRPAMIQLKSVNTLAAMERRDTLRVLFLTNSGPRDASSRVRVYQYQAALRARGIHGRVLPLQMGSRLAIRARELLALCLAPLHHAVVIQKNVFPGFTRAIVALNKRVIFDIDDGVFVFFPDSVNLLPMYAHIVAGNTALLEFMKPFNSNISVIPSVVSDCRQHDRNGPSDQVVIGWIGHGAHLRYLQPLRAVFSSLLHSMKGRALLRIVSDVPLDWSDVHVDNRQWTLEHELDDVRTFDIGIMPVGDDAWGQYKCGYKALLYMSQGIPTIASPVGFNAQLLSHGRDGMLASTADDWAESLRALIESPVLRRELGRQGQARVAKDFTVEARVHDWEQLLRRVARRT